MSFPHQSSIRALGLSADGLWLAIGHADKSVVLWNTLTGERQPRPLTTEAGIRHVRFSPDGKYLALSMHEPPGEGVVELRELATGKVMGRPLRHRDNVAAFAFSPDGRALATACTDHSARVWEARTGEAISPWLPHEFEAERVAFSRDGNILATLARRGAVRLWNPRTGEPLSPQIQYLRDIGDGAVSISPDGQRLLICRGANEAWLRDLRVERASLQELKPLSAVLSCTRLDPTAGIVPLDTASLNQAWKELSAVRARN